MASHATGQGIGSSDEGALVAFSGGAHNVAKPYNIMMCNSSIVLLFYSKVIDSQGLRVGY